MTVAQSMIRTHMNRPNYITPAGYTVLREEYEHLLVGERPKLVETISWAAGNTAVLT